MMNIKSMVVACSGYPTATDSVCPFVEQVVNAFSKKDISVTVVAPQSIIKHYIRGTELHPKKRIYTYQNGFSITVYQPYILSFGNKFDKINMSIRSWSIYRTLKRNKIDADIYYGHFWHHAYSLFRYAKEKHKPLFVVSGESEISIHRVVPRKLLNIFCNYVSGLICVSTKNLDESIEKKLLSDTIRRIVIPNAVDDNLFKVLDRETIRFQHGVAKDDFVVAFVGWYDENKGVLRVSDAVKKIRNSHIKLIFIGDNRDKGNMTPDCDGIIHTGRLPHDTIPEYLNMADVFVLPTLHEGCNNAIIEAMACGLPVISSNLPFNSDVMNESNSIKVDPYDIDEISNAIKSLLKDPERRKLLSEGALETARSLTIFNRAERILKFINQTINN